MHEEFPTCKIFVIGGASLYEQTIENAEELRILVWEDFEGDTYFPKYDNDKFNLKNIEASQICVILLSLYSQMKYLLLLFMSKLFGEEPIRTFTAQAKHSSSEYKGKLIVLENAQGQRFQVVTYSQQNDQDYVEGSNGKNFWTRNTYSTKTTSQSWATKDWRAKHSYYNQSKETFREGSFFRHPPILLEKTCVKRILWRFIANEGEPVISISIYYRYLMQKYCCAPLIWKGDRKIAPKAGLQLIIRNGNERQFERRGSYCGEAEESIVEVVTLPTDDEMFMPPKTAMTPTEVDT